MGAKQWSLWFSDWVNRDENMTDTVTEKEKKKSIQCKGSMPTQEVEWSCSQVESKGVEVRVGV